MDTAHDTCDAILARLSPELRGGDDRALWELAVRETMSDVAKLDGIDPVPRRLLVAFARVPGKRAGIHPDEQASLFLAWERDRDESEWRFVGTHPHVERRRGSYAAAVCVPQGTTRLAYVDVVVLWRPRAPWASRETVPRTVSYGPGRCPQDTEMGRQLYRFRRDADAKWRFGGVREE
jgi:hypothetical protein